MSDQCDVRDGPFRDMLLAISKQLREHDVEELKYLTECQRCGCKPLELLTSLRNKGMFSPYNCSPLEDLLKKIERHDLADDVKNKYVAFYPDLTSPPGVKSAAGRRERSATDPYKGLAVSTPSDLDIRSISSDGFSMLQQDSDPATVTSGTGAGSLDNVLSNPTTPASVSQRQHVGLTRSPPSGTSMSLRSISQSSQEYGSYLSSSSSCVSSSSSLHQGSLTQAVLERTSAMLLDRVTTEIATFGHHPSGHSRSFHGPHNTPNPDTIQLQLTTSRTLPPGTAPALCMPPAAEPIRRPSISEIYSDQEEECPGRRGTLECPTSRSWRARQAEQDRGGYDSNTLQPPRGRESENERCRTPRAAEQPGGTQEPHTQGACIAQPLPSLKPVTNKPLCSKERNWRKCFTFFGKHKSKSASSNGFMWKVHRDDLSKPIWGHDEKRCITRSHKYELDANLHRHNPKLSFKLYPYGESDDRGEYATMIVRITTSDKCPPLPTSAKVHVSLTVTADTSDKDRMLNKCSVAEYLDLGFFRIHRVAKHDQLMKSHSKYIYFNFEITCSGVEIDSSSRHRLSTL